MSYKVDLSAQRRPMLRNGRRLVMAGTVSAVIIPSFIVIGAVAFGWRLGLSSNANATASIATIASVASFLLVAIGVLVALLAYLQASGTPKLRIAIDFRYSFTNAPVFAVEEDRPEAILSYRQVEGKVALINDSKFAAKHPGVRIELRGLGMIDMNRNRGWQIVERANQIGAYILQWDGGADSVVHSRWSRQLPELDFTGVEHVAETSPALIVTVAADGVDPETISMPVLLLEREAYEKYSAVRAEFYRCQRCEQGNTAQATS